MNDVQARTEAAIEYVDHLIADLTAAEAVQVVEAVKYGMQVRWNGLRDDVRKAQ